MMPVMSGKARKARYAPAPPQKGKRGGLRLNWAATLAALLLAVPMGALAYLLPLHSQSLNLALREKDGQLIVSWNARANTMGGQLEFADGSKRLITTIQPGQA